MPIQVVGPSGTANSYAFLDDGANISVCDKNFARGLGIRGSRLNLCIKGTNDHEAVKMCSEKVNFRIHSETGEFAVQNAVLAENLNFPTQSIEREIVRYVAKHVGVFIQPFSCAQPKLLIGQDNWRLLASKETRGIVNTDLAATLTTLGWVIHGRTSVVETKQKINTLTIVENTTDATEDERLDELVKHYFENENLGIHDKIIPNPSKERVLKILRETSRRVGNAWETGLLWKELEPPNIDSRATAFKRLRSLEKRLDRDPEYATLYYAEMNRFFKSGYAVESRDEETRPRSWYLPHFGVTSASKPGKIRLVFDAAAKSAGVSLNDQLEAGPDLLQSLLGVLIRFRQYAIAFKADIRDMYLRVKIREEDRGALKFLWRGENRKVFPKTFEMTCLVFGANSSPCSALYVKDNNARDFETTKPDAAKSIIKNSYVDDYLSSRNSVEESKTLIRDLININSKANFSMHGWASNDRRVLEEINNEPPAHNSHTSLCDQGRERVLGLFWDTDSDMLGFKIGVERIPVDLKSGARKPTKREFLRVIMSVYDPLGLLSPFTLQSRILMQEVWRSGFGWDDALRDEENVGWLSWMRNLQRIGLSRVHRCISPKNTNYVSVQLHVFCDASLKAYAAAIYIRFEIPNESARVTLLIGKSKVAPLKPLSIPRLELQAALLGARLLATATQEIEFSVHKRVLWSDSQTVVRWIKTEPRTRQVFVAHRLGQISEITATSEWRWVPTRLNPADSATRWTNETNDANDIWVSGPEFLRLPESQWPAQKPLSEEEKKSIDEMESRKMQVYSVEIKIDSLPLTARLLGWRGLLAVGRRVRGYFLRWRKRIPNAELSNDVHEAFWFREIQQQCFASEISALMKGEHIKKGSKITNVCPFLDEERILRANGRVEKIAGLDFTNHPIILDGKHPATRLLIAEYHRKFYHANDQSVINEIRQRFYVISLRTSLKSIAHKCLFCKLRRAKPKNPIMAPIPTARLAYRQRPFSHCGLDYFGPMQVKIGRRREKRWGVLFTCLTVRAVHLELAHSLNASSAIMALQRLSSRRGCPLAVYSDNGTNFRGACRELCDEVKKLDRNKFKEYALLNGMRWSFNPPDAPHMGGAWERLIRTVKTALAACLNEQAPSEEVLYTLLTEIEHSVNSRPLTHVSVDPRDSEALTPNHFLIGTSSGEIKLNKYNAKNWNPKKQWKIAQAFADAFWKRWLREYVPTLVARAKWNKNVNELKINDFVLIVDLQAPRNVWKKGKITQVFPGIDNVIRVAQVSTNSGRFVRPVHKLIKLFNEHDEVQN